MKHLCLKKIEKLTVFLRVGILQKKKFGSFPNSKSTSSCVRLFKKKPAGFFPEEMRERKKKKTGFLFYIFCF